MGAEGKLVGTLIFKTGYHGVDVSDHRPAPTSDIVPSKVALEKTLITDAAEVGIFVTGSELTVTQSAVQKTYPLNPAPADLGAPASMAEGWSRGIAAFPSGWSRDGQTAGPEQFAPSLVTIDQSAIVGNAVASIAAQGSTVTISDSFVGSIPGGSPSGRGVSVERSLPVRAPASLLETGRARRGREVARVERDTLDDDIAHDDRVAHRTGHQIFRDVKVRSRYRDVHVKAADYG